MCEPVGVSSETLLRVSLFLMTRKCQGCEFFELGASRPASRILRRLSSLIVLLE